MVFGAVPRLFFSCTLCTPFVTLGTLKVTEVSDHEEMEAEVVPNKTLPVEAPKPFPAMVTVVPDCPTVGPVEPTSGAAALAVNCQTAAVCAPRVKLVTGLLPPDPAETVIPAPPRVPLR